MYLRVFDEAEPARREVIIDIMLDLVSNILIVVSGSIAALLMAINCIEFALAMEDKS